jgi:NAD(P)-dependent dehydrogenase (short-subunit alcohol dehydrogenase family)
MRSVAITGASTGIGRAAALRLERSGWRVFAGVRREEDAEALREVSIGHLTALRLDITDLATVEEADRQIRSATGDRGLDGLVNNAGIAVFSPVETIPMGQLRAQLEVNLIGQVAVTKTLLPLIRSASGRIVFVGSLGGRMSYPFGGAYHASKYGLEAIADCLRQELRPWKIGVSMVEPGAVDTSIWDRGRDLVEQMSSELTDEQVGFYAAAMDRSLRWGDRLHAIANSPDKVARAIERALNDRRPRHRYQVGIDALAQTLVHRVVPQRAFDWVVGKSLGLGGG